ncbi:MAG: cache domain-containing protein [Burkholderiaceae bacterium]
MSDHTSTHDRHRHRDGFFAYHGAWAPGVRLFRALSFASKAVIISFSFIAPMLALLVWQVGSEFDRALQARKESTRQHVEIAHDVISWAQREEAAGRMTRDAAQALAKAQLAGMRYDKNEYFWINDERPSMIMHPIKPQLDGSDLSTFKDPNGLLLFKEMVAVVKRDGAGYVSYQWPKPGAEHPVDKVSYVKGFKPWGWIVGTGIYVDDIQTAVMARVEVIGAIVAGSLLLAGYLFMSFYRVMDGGLKETRRHLVAITEGDLTTAPTPWGRDEAALLMLDLRKMQESLRGIVRSVRDASGGILSSSTEMADGAIDLATRTERATAAIESSAASMGEIGDSAKVSMANTSEAAGIARQNAQDAASGGQSMHAVVATMNEIRESSVGINEIIGTIDGIALQTRLLALNAAVEAARAGEQGRGFGVVASEVRALAQRSAEAANQIKSMIGQSVEKVEAGAHVVALAETAIGSIVDGCRKVDALLSEVADGVREQNSGVERIGAAINDLDRMTHENGALVERTVTAAAAMKQQANDLAAEVERFRLPG